MKRLVIVIDCDDVLVHGTEYVIKTYNRLYGTNVQLANAHTSGNLEWVAERDEVFRRLNAIQTSKEYASIQPPKSTVGIVRRLAKDYELHLITARPNEVMGVTQTMVDSYFSECFTSVSHIGPDGGKGEACKALRADMIVDDNLKHLVSAKACGVMYRMWFGDYAWQSNDPEPDIATDRCKDWLEVENFVAKITA